jgi:phosphodiesterase/alkaline phosphatase D-like protein
VQNGHQRGGRGNSPGQRHQFRRQLRPATDGLTEATIDLGVNEVVYQWSGALQPTSATVVAKLSHASTSCRLVVSTSAALTSPVLSPAATASSSNNNMAKMTIRGLLPNTTYYYAVQSDGVTDNSAEDVGRFRTPAAGAFSFRFTVGSCAVNSDHQVYTLMRYKLPLFHLTTGDFHYANPNSGTDISVHRLPYEQNMLSQAASRAFFLRTPVAYVWDDHDYSGNNSNGISAGRANARQGLPGIRAALHPGGRQRRRAHLPGLYRRTRPLHPLRPAFRADEYPHHERHPEDLVQEPVPRRPRQTPHHRLGNGGVVRGYAY